MPGEEQLAAGCEDTHVVVRVGIRWRQKKSRFREIGPARERGHLRFDQSLGGMYNGERIPAQWICREDIDLGERIRGHTWSRLTFAVSGKPLVASALHGIVRRHFN